jgi:hypothetical protein
MSIPKKGTRKIMVDGEPFIWLIRRQATNMQADYGCGNLHVAVQHAQEPGSVLVGWQPQLPGITFEVRIAGLFMEKI